MSTATPPQGATPAHDRSAQYAIALLIVVLAACALGWAWMRRTSQISLPGRWTTTLTDSKGLQGPCDLDILASGVAAFSDACPPPWRDFRGTVVASPGIQDKGVFALLAPGLQPLLGGFVVGHPAHLLGLPGAQMEMRTSAQTTIDWQRLADVESIPTQTVDLFPPRAAWPVAGVGTLVDRVRYYLQLTWRPDAVVMDATFFGGGKPFVQGLPPHWDAGDFRVTAYSPASHAFRSFLGARLLTQDMPNYSVYQADPAFAVPAAFLDLPEAVSLAQTRGFSVDSIRQAGLRYWSLEPTAQQPARVLGMGWLLLNGADQTIYVPALPNQGAVLCIQTGVEHPC